MGMPRRILGALHAWFYTPRPVHSLALARVFIGATMFIGYILYLPDLDWYFGEGGVADVFGTYKGGFELIHTWLWPLYGLLLLSALLFMVGLATPWAGLCLAACQAIFAQGGIYHTWGWFTVIAWFVLYIALAGSGRWLSVDAWLAKRRGQPLSPLAEPWALRLLEVHVCTIYLAAAWHRVDDAAWVRGELVYEAVINSWFSRVPHLDLRALRPLLQLITWATELLEALAPVAFWLPWTRRVWIYALIVFHIGLHLGASVGMWQPMMVSALTAMIAPAEAERCLRLLCARLGLPEPNYGQVSSTVESSSSSSAQSGSSAT
jgi:hypothetical protein